MMNNTLKITGVLSDPTRFNIYEYITDSGKEVTVLDISKKFGIHPNVARLHLSKLVDIHLLYASTQKTGRGGRPSRVYRLSDTVVELSFPHRDFKLLSKIALESLIKLGPIGEEALYASGKSYGTEFINQKTRQNNDGLTDEERLSILKDTANELGMYTTFNLDQTNRSISFIIQNCPFKEVVSLDSNTICKMHYSFIKGMLKALFSDIKLIEQENMFQGCENCSYVAQLLTV